MIGAPGSGRRQRRIGAGRMALLGTAGLLLAGIIAALLLGFHVGQASAAPTVACSPSGTTLDVTLSGSGTQGTATDVQIELSGSDIDVLSGGASVCTPLSSYPVSSFSTVDVTDANSADTYYVDVVTPDAFTGAHGGGCLEFDLSAADSTGDFAQLDTSSGSTVKVNPGTASTDTKVTVGSCSDDVVLDTDIQTLVVDGTGTTDELDLLDDTTDPLTVNGGGNSLVDPGTVSGYTGLQSGMSTISFYDENTVKGANSEVDTTFQPGTAPALAFEGTSASATTLDLCDKSGSSCTDTDPFTIAMNEDSSGAGVGTLTSTSPSISDSFWDVGTVDGSNAADDFQPGTAASASGVTFLGAGSSNTLDLCSIGTIASPCADTASFAVAAGADSSGSGEGSVTSTSPAIADSFADVQTVDGSGATGTGTDDFQPGTATGVTFVGSTGAAANVLDLCAKSGSSCTNTTSFTIAVGENTPGSGAGVEGTLSGGTVADSFAGITTIDGSGNGGSGVDDFQPGTSGGVDFIGSPGAASNTLDLCDKSGSACTDSSPYTTAMDGNSTGTPGALSSTSLTASPVDGTSTDSFSAVTTVDGSGGANSFQPGTNATASGVTFIGASNVTNTLDLCASNGTHCTDTASFTVAMGADSSGSGEGTVTSTSPALSDSFSNITTVDGSGNASTGADVFQPGTATGVTFVGSTGAASNTIDLCSKSGSACTNTSSFTVAMGANTAIGNGTLSSSSPAISDSFAAVTAIDGSGAGGTGTDVFQPGTGGGVDFLGSSGASANVLDLCAKSGIACTDTDSYTVAMGADTSGTQGALSSASLTPSDSFSNVTTVDGSGASSTGDDVFQPGTAPDVTFLGSAGAAANTLDLCAYNGTNCTDTGNFTVAMGSNTAGAGEGSLASSSPSISDSFAAVTVVDASGGTDDLQPGTATDVDFVGAAPQGTATLDLSGESTGFNSFTVTMDLASASADCLSGVGQVVSSGSNQIEDCFTGLSTVKGAGVPTTIAPTTSDVTFIGESGVSNILDLSTEPSSAFSTLSAAMTGGPTESPCGAAAVGEVTGTGTDSVTDPFCNVATVLGSTSVPTTFYPGPATGATFVGQSTGDILNLTSEPGSPEFTSFDVEMNDTSAPCSNEGELTSTGTGSQITDCFSGIATVKGTTVPTTFQPSTGSVTFAGGAGVTNTLDLRGESSSFYSALAADMSGGPSETQLCASSPVGEIAGTGVGSTPNFTDPYCNISTVEGAISVPTTFFPDPTLTQNSTISFVGNDTSTNSSVVDVANFVSPDTSSNAVTNLAVSLNGDSSSNPGLVTADVGGPSQIQFASFYGVDEEIATFSPAGNPSPAPVTSALVLPSLGNALDVSVNGDVPGSAAQVTGLSTGANDFYGMSTIEGNSGTGGTTFNADEVINPSTSAPVDLYYEGEGQGHNTLSFTALSIGTNNLLTIDASAALTATIGTSSPGSVTIASFNSGVQFFGGCDIAVSCKGTNFDAGSGTNFDGLGVANPGAGNVNSVSFGGLATTTVDETAGSGTAAPSITFDDVQTFIGSADGGDSFTIGSNSVPETFYGSTGGTPDSINFSSDNGITLNWTTGVTVSSGSENCTSLSNCTEEEAAITGAGGGGVVDAYDFATFIGASSGSNTFNSDGYGGHTYEAGGGVNLLDLDYAAVPAGITVNAQGTCVGGLPDCVTGLSANTSLPGSPTTDSFSGIETFDGPPTGTALHPTTFESAGTASQLLFQGDAAGTNVLNVSNAPQGGTGITDDGSGGEVSFANGNLQSFSNIGQFYGSKDGDTTFVVGTTSPLASGSCASASPSSATFVGQGAASSNKLDISASSAAIVTTPPSALQSAFVCTATATPSLLETFTGIADVVGPLTGGSTFVTGQVGGYTFTGQGQDDTVSFQAVSPGAGGVTVELDTSPPEAICAAGVDTFTGISTVDGSPNNDTIIAGPTSFNINTSPGLTSSNFGTETLSFADEEAGVDLSWAGTTADVTSELGTTTTADDISTFIGSDAGDNLFDLNSNGGYAFDAPSGTTDNSLSAASISASISVAVPPTGQAGSVGGLAGGHTTDSFTNIQNFTGASGGSSSTVDSLSYAAVLTGVTFDLSASVQSVTSTSNNSIDDTISGFEQFTGSHVGGNVFDAPAGGGYTFTGEGSPNTLDLAAVANTTGISIGSTSVTGLDAGDASAITNAGTGSPSTDDFTGISSFTGSLSEPSTFTATCSGGQTIDGQGPTTTLQFPSPTGCPGQSVTINAATGSMSITGATLGADSFTGVSIFDGPASGATTFVAPGQAAGYSFVGSGSGNTLDTSNFGPNSTIDDTSTGSDATSQEAVLASQANDPFTDISCFVGSSAGEATFVASATLESTATTGECTETGLPHLMFDAEGSGNAINLAAVNPGNSIIVCAALTSQQLTTTPDGCTSANAVLSSAAFFDTFTQGVQSFSGSNAQATTFVAADANGQTYAGGLNNSTPLVNTLWLQVAQRSTLVDTSSNTVDLDGTTTKTLSFSNIDDFEGSSAGFTTFRPDISQSYGFTGYPATSGNVLDLSNGPAGTTVNAGSGSVTLGTRQDTFANMSTFIGPDGGSTRFIAPATAPSGGTTFTGQGESNSLSFATPQSDGKGLTINLDGGNVTQPTTRAITDGSFTAGQNSLFDNTGQSFTFADVGSTVTGAGIPSGTTILAVISPAQATMSNAATGTSSGETVTLVGTVTVASFSDMSSITGSPQSDVFLDGPSNVDLNGGGGTDTLSLVGAPTAATVNLSTGSVTGGYGGTLSMIPGTIQNVIVGNEGATVTGDRSPSVFTEGSATNDFILAGGNTAIDVPTGLTTGSTTINYSGAPASVSLTVNLGLSSLETFSGENVGWGFLSIPSGASAIQTVIGGNGHNALTGGSSPITLEGGPNGPNTLTAGSGTTTLEAGGGDATLIGGSGTDTMIGARGDDTFDPGSAIGSITDTLGTGTLNESNALNSVLANLGTSSFTIPAAVSLPPSVNAGTTLPAEQVTVLGSSSKYSLDGVVNVDGSIHGDVLVGSSAANVITAGNSTRANVIVGNGGGDKLVGGGGLNAFITGSGNNTVVGGAGGRNTIDYASAPKSVRVNLQSGSALQVGAAAPNGFGGTDELYNIQNIIGSPNDGDVLRLGTETGTITGGNGNGDEYTGSSDGEDTIVGGDGEDDTFTAEGPNDSMIGGDGGNSFFATDAGVNPGYLTFINGGSGFNFAAVDCGDVLASPPTWYVKKNGKEVSTISQLQRPAVCKLGKPSVIKLALAGATVAYGKEGNAVFTATVTPDTPAVPTGTAVVLNGKVTICTIHLVNGSGHCSPGAATLAPGKISIAADYNGDINFSSSRSPSVTLDVVKAGSTSSLSLSSSRVTFGDEEAIRYTVTLAPQFTGTPTGKVQIKSGNILVCTVSLSKGKGSCSAAASQSKQLAAGAHSMIGYYGGDTNFNPSKSVSRTLTVV